MNDPLNCAGHGALFIVALPRKLAVCGVPEPLLEAARVGSAATTSPLTNNVTVNAGGSVILNGGTATGAATTHRYADNGTYTATLTVSDGQGGSTSDSLVVTVPCEEQDRLSIAEGATVTVEVREARIRIEPVLAPDLRAASVWALEHGLSGLKSLA